MQTSPPVQSGPSAALASIGQRHLWLFDRFYAHDGTYNVAFGVRLKGALDLEVLRTSLNAIVERHEALRTTFAQDGDDLLQVIADTLHLDVPPIDLSGLPETDAESDVAERLADDAAAAFDLANGPLLRAKLYRLAPDHAVLSVVVHHIVFDGWSLGIFLSELGEIYSSIVEHRPIALPELPIQYADYAEWQREQLDTPAAAANLDYWRRTLDGVARRIELPTDRPYLAVHSRRGRVLRRRAPDGIRSAANELAKKERATLFMVLISALAVVVERYAKQDDFLIATPMAGRSREELEPLIGFVMKLVLVRARVPETVTFRELVAAMKRSTIEAREHEDTPLEQLNALLAGTNASSLPTLQVMIALQNATPAPAPFAGLDVSMIWAHNGTAKYDLSLNATDEGGVLYFDLEYDSGLFDETTAIRLIDSFEAVLREAALNPDRPISRLPVLSRQDRILINRVNSTARAFPRDRTVHELFEQQVGATPDAVAVASGPTRWTYRELDDRANAIARELRAHGIGPDRLVGLCVNRSAGMVAALLGILKSGGAYVPIDPSYPADRIAWMLENSRAAVLVTERAVVDALPRGSVPLLFLDGDRSADETPASPPVASQSDDLAYVLYTSGSTGRPKGVEISHRALVNFLTSMRAEPGLRPHDVLLAVTTLSFDISGLELLLPLVTGASVVVAPREASADPALLATLLEDTGATVLQATPSTWRLLVESGWAGRDGLKALCGGEAMPADLAKALLGRTAELWNMYGPTETTIWSTCRRIVDERIDIGHPIANTDVVIVDEAGAIVPIGVRGEILIGGEGLARGYFGRPDLTAERFIVHPLDAERRAYRTGDLGRWQADGTIECFGRLDHQVKLRGFRIEPGEIEIELSRQPGVGSSVVMVREDQPGNQQLVAYFERRGEPPSTAELRSALQRTLPWYMVPSAYVPLARLPLTPNGKIDRRALPKPEADLASAGHDAFVAPATTLEADLCRIWREVIGIEHVGVTDSFFDLGGHSLMAVRLFARVRELTRRDFSFGLLLQYPTIRELARFIEPGQEQTANGRPRALTPLRTTGTRPPIFFLHTVGGEVWSFTGLTRHLGDNQPVYGLQASTGADAPQSVTEMAARYIEEIRTVLPDGPYLLAGHCAGAATAFEMARQLSAAGKDVPLVAVLDYTFFDTADRRWLRGLTDMVVNLPAWLADDFFQVGLATIAGRVKSRWRLLTTALTRGRQTDADIRDRLGMWRFPTYQVPGLEHYFEVFQRYQPGSYDGDVLLIKPRALPLLRLRQADDLGWTRVVNGQVIVRVVRGSHETMLHEPLVEGVASTLTAAIDEIIATRHG